MIQQMELVISSEPIPGVSDDKPLQVLLLMLIKLVALLLEYL